MEFVFNINKLFENDISLVDKSLTPYKQDRHAYTENSSTRSSGSDLKTQLCKVIDDIGEASAKAQQLHGTITTAGRLAHSDHHVYIKKDPHANGGYGSIVGFLRVGCKKLFVYDHQGIQHEMEPLCILDFYVHESCQRMGYGRMIFDEMMRSEQMVAHEFAVDRPSPKMLGFLAKHYGLRATIPQVNNFVVFEGFFREKSSSATQRGKRRSQLNRPPTHPNRKQDSLRGLSRDSGLQTSSSPSLRDDGHSLEPLDRDLCLGPLDRDRNALKDIALVRSRPTSGSQQANGQTNSHQSNLNMVAQLSLYSRHSQSTPVLGSDSPNNRPARGVPSPPLLRRDGPPVDYQQLLSPDYKLDRRGHLVPISMAPAGMALTAGGQQFATRSTPTMGTAGSACDKVKAPLPDPFGPQLLRTNATDTTFNIFGIPSAKYNSHKTSTSGSPSSLPTYHKTALW